MIALRPLARLVRLPNLPTALADIGLGALATSALPERWAAFLLLMLASACLYSAGMVWNDFFDREQDRRERPDRPLPSGEIRTSQAAWLGAGLMIGGIVLAGLASLTIGSGRPILLAGFLVLAIFLYDAWLKRTNFGPVAMGACRFLNVLLGVSLAGSLEWPLGPHLALVVGLYIVGVTWLARTEARVSSQVALAGAGAVMFAGMALALPLPIHRPAGASSPLFPYLLVLLGFAVGIPVRRAVATPSPARVQDAVKRSLLCLIVLDAILASAIAGTIGLSLLALLIPSLYLNRRRWLYAT
jgi:4-hydroxybenzoate polyprenyltransferase